LGVGLGYRDVYREPILDGGDEIDFLEITADHFFNCDAARERLLCELREAFTLIPHGLSLSLGSAEGFNRPYFEKLKPLIRAIDPPWWSEHISFTQSGGVEIGHLAPVPFNREGLNVLCENIGRVQEEVEVPLILENITYGVELPWNDMAEADFLTELLERQNCGLLLDVTNLYVNSITHRYDPLEFLARLPLERVVQLHFVGVESKEGKLIDNHARATNSEIWDLLEEVCRRAPVKGAILERDQNFPPFKEIREELQHAREIGVRHERWA
jgi:uncharacterized protein